MHSANDNFQPWEMDEDPIYIYSLEQLAERGVKSAGEVDVMLDPVIAVIGWYSNLSVECALADRTPHKKGYLCRTASGAEVCVGHICGKRHLGDEFKKLINRMRSRHQ